MYFLQSTAQAIVEEIQNEIHEQLNMMDENGKIIASTDPNRIGVVHEGAKRIIDEHLTQLYITKDMENSTTKEGLNLPIVVQNEIIGVIGITGEKEKVEPFGNIVRRMTEIMLEDSIVKDDRRLDRRVRYRFLENWIKDDGMAISPPFIQRGQKINIDITKPRRIVMLRLKNYLELSSKLEGQRKMEDIEIFIRQYIRKIPDALYLREPTRQICFIPACSDEKIKQIVDKIVSKVKEEFNEEIFVGIDGRPKGDVLVHNLCEEAGKALDSCSMTDKLIRFYNELDMELFMEDIDEVHKREYLTKLFKGISIEEMEYNFKILEVYFDCDGSINAAAEKLFIHKNTLQYKLKKIEEITGNDVRKPLGTAILYIALEFYHELYGSSYFLRS